MGISFSQGKIYKPVVDTDLGPNSNEIYITAKVKGNVLSILSLQIFSILIFIFYMWILNQSTSDCWVYPKDLCVVFGVEDYWRYSGVYTDKKQSYTQGNEWYKENYIEIWEWNKNYDLFIN